MKGQVIEVILSPEQRAELVYHSKYAKKHCLRVRCKMVLLKADKMASWDIAKKLELSAEPSINRWIKRYLNDYETLGINALSTKRGQGAKPILTIAEHGELVRTEVSKERQRMACAKQQIELKTGKKMSTRTLNRFLKNLTPNTSEFAAIRNQSQMKNSMQ